MMNKSDLLTIAAASLLAIALATPAEAQSAEEEHQERNRQRKLTKSYFQNFQKREKTNFQNLVAEVGEPISDVGSGIYIYTYKLADHTWALVGTPDRQKIMYIRFINHDPDSSGPFFVKPQSEQRLGTMIGCGQSDKKSRAAWNGRASLTTSGSCQKIRQQLREQVETNSSDTIAERLQKSFAGKKVVLLLKLNGGNDAGTVDVLKSSGVKNLDDESINLVKAGGSYSDVKAGKYRIELPALKVTSQRAGNADLKI